MKHWKLLIVVASAAAALATGVMAPTPAPAPSLMATLDASLGRLGGPAS